MAQENHIAYFVKYSRTKAAMTQEELAEKAGVGLRFIRDLEQGKETLRIDKVNQVLALFGYKMVPGNARLLDPYEVLMKYVNIAVQIYLKNRNELSGIILGPIYEGQEIRGWRFVSNNHASRYRNNQDELLVQTVSHADIEELKNQQL